MMTRLSVRPSFIVAVCTLSLATIAQSQTPPPGPAGVPLSAALPLPAAMIRLAIPDVPALDAALGGGFKKALYGTLPEDDGVARGFGQSQVGAKLEDQWARFRGDTMLSFQTLNQLQASAAALAVLDIGHMEMVLVLETPLAALPELFEEGTSRIESGRTYHLVRTGAGDEGADGETRMGLAWSRDAGLLVMATSERAMKLSLAALARGERFAPRLGGLASLELDMDALQGDLYFKRDFLFGARPEKAAPRGKIHAAIRLESGRLVEVREGNLEGERTGAGSRGAIFEAPDAVASGWVGDASQILTELRRGVLEPLPAPGLLPQRALAPLPSAKAASEDDRYTTNIEVASAIGVSAYEAAELEAWQALLSSQPVSGFGYLVTKSRARLLAIPWPRERDAELGVLLEATLTRRGARLGPSSTSGGIVEYLMGPGLPVLAFKRSGEFVWISTTAADLRGAPAIAWSSDITRFSKLNVAAVRDEARRWARIEGPRSSDTVRPLSDRGLGLLGWIPTVRALEVERRVTGGVFRERVVFGVAPPAAPSAAK